MKAKHIFIVFLIVVLLGVGALASLYFVDGISAKDFASLEYARSMDKNFLRPNKKIYEDVEVSGISEIQADDINLALVVKEGKEGLEVWSNRKLNVDEYLDYELKSRKLTIKDKYKELPPASQLELVISVEDPEKLDINIKNVNGVLTIEDTIKSLHVEQINGVFESDTDETYDIFIDEANGVLDFSFDNFDARLDIDSASGLVSVDDVDLDFFEDHKSIHQVFGEGTSRIYIKNADGIIDISN